MPQLSPAPWFYTLLITWLIIFRLLKWMTNLYSPKMPTKLTLSHQLTPWFWTWL